MMLLRRKFSYNTYEKLSILLFSICTVILFIYLNRVQPYYFIDEMFHIPQALRYCAGNFTQLDPKITTLPGLYLLTALVLSPINLCNIIAIRCTNLLGTILNLYLMHNILKKICQCNQSQKWNEWMELAVSYNISLLPPLFFWHFLYYTDVISLTAVLLMLLLYLHKSFKLSAFIGFVSILVRQTNIIWVAFLTLERALDLLDCKIKKSMKADHNSIRYLSQLWKLIVEEAYRGPTSLIKFIAEICGKLLPYITICLLFVMFVIWNNGIVIGDRTAHIATIHVPQLFYFSVFIFGFSWPYMIVHWGKYLKFLQEHWILASCLFVVLTVIVHCNTLVHPYILADNRHYVFYIWNKFMGKYVIFKYLLIPAYTFTMYTMLYNISHLRFTTQINYITMVAAVLIPQLLVEPRYFIIPYIFYRLSLPKPKNWQIIMESLTTLVVNFLQFFIFVNKEFYWGDQLHPQRISW